ncbi:hypothetical protein LY76DRAFT_589055 [Colletotrichum caudatum]|nr:hypothetical protein LY76DRAFT_589055 [Colletotrichum caudatum]
MARTGSKPRWEQRTARSSSPLPLKARFNLPWKPGSQEVARSVVYSTCSHIPRDDSGMA